MAVAGLKAIGNSLTIRLVAAVVLAFVFLIIGFYFSSYRTLEITLLKNIHLTVGQTSQLINATVASASSTKSSDLSTLQAYFGEMLNAEAKSGIVYIVVGRGDGTVLLHSAGAGAAVPNADLKEDFDAAARRGIIHVRDRVLLGSSEIGFVQYGLATRDTVHALQQGQRNSLILTSVVMLATFATLVILGLGITRRLSDIKAASEEIAAGRYDRRLQVIGSDELSEVAQNFNRMSDAVEHKMQEISELNASLERRVMRRTNELQITNKVLEDNLEQLERAKDNLVKSEKLAGLGALVAGVAHELNTPIGNALVVATSVHKNAQEFGEIAMTGKVSRSGLESFIRHTIEGCELSERSLTRAAELVQNFKQVAVDQSSQRRRSFNLAQVVAETVATLRHSFSKLPYRLEIDIPDDIVMDSYPGPLGQIISNLITNALLHAFDGRESGIMRLTARLSLPDSLQLTFADDGNGISPENLKRIFDPFFTTRMGKGGSGLGLSIIHNLTETLLGGSVNVTSELGKGTTFLFVLMREAPDLDAGSRER